MTNYFGYPLFITSPRYTPKPVHRGALGEPVLWKRKTCKTCGLFWNSHCRYCRSEFGLYRIKTTHAACINYEPKNK